MKNITMHVPTRIYFGKGQIENLASSIKAYGNKVLFVYGGGSIKKTGLYDTVVEILNNNGIEFWELAGVTPNPKITTVREGVEICREHGIEVVLAVGGGSVFDCSKAIAASVSYAGDPWDLVIKKGKVVSVLPVIVVSTLAATGSEMDTSAVISNLETNEKLGLGHADMRPRAAILDPEYTMTVPKQFKAAGVVDIMSHVMEYYFNNYDTAGFQDRVGEAMLINTIEYGKKAYDDPNDYDAHANLLYTSVWALTGLIGKGFPNQWTVHFLEQEISGYYNTTHGAGLAILIPQWFRYSVQFDSTLPKFVDYGVNVWKIDPKGKTDREIAMLSIEATEDYFKSINMPSRLAELNENITDEYFEEMADHIMSTVDNAALENCFVPLNRENILEMLRMCL